MRMKKLGDVGFNRYACACSMIASGISITLGFENGVMTGARIFIKEDHERNDTRVEFLADILNICAIVGSLIAGRMSDHMGRRFTITFASVTFLLGSVVMGCGLSYAVLMTGRCMAGVGMGSALVIAPVYSVEISSTTHRGFLTTLPGICISLGTLLGYVTHYLFEKLIVKLGWRMMLGVGAIPSLALAFGILKIPESPRWLVMQGRLDEAKKVLLLVCNSEQEVEAQFQNMLMAAGIDKNCKEDVVKLPGKTRGEGVWKELLLGPSSSVRWIFLATVGLHFFEHAMGAEAVIFYGQRIFEKAGVTSKKMLLLATVGIGLSKETFVIIATFLVDKIGRRRLLLGSTGGIIVALTGLGFFLTKVEHAKEELSWALVSSIVATYSIVAFFAIGIAPVTLVYTTEIFPLKLRAQGASIGVAVNQFMKAVVLISFLPISKAITIGGSFFMFACISLLALGFFYYCLPETKGKPLEEIGKLFTRRNSNVINSGMEIQLNNI